MDGMPPPAGRLDRLLRPRHVAVIGGGAWGEGVVRALDGIGFRGPVWPVHPRRAELAGRACIPDLDALPEPPDAAFLAINREAAIPALEQLAAMGAGGAIAFAAGFAEAARERRDGPRLQRALVRAAGGMPVLGPNCYGLLNYLDGVALWPDQHGGARVDRGVAIVTQSSNIAINLTMQRRGLPIAYMVTAGNQAQTGWAEIALALIEDPRVTALGLHLEGMGDLVALERLARRARCLKKPIVALKTGASRAARAASLSHTAAIAGSDAGARALMARLGIARAASPAQLIETLKLLHGAGWVGEGGLLSLSCSGGEAGLVADAAAAAGLHLPPLGPARKARLRAALGPDVALANPLDYQTRIWGDRAAMAEVFTAMLDGPGAIGCLVLDFPRADRCDAAAWDPALDAGAEASRAAGKPLAVVSSLADTMDEGIAARIAGAGLIPLSGLTKAMAALAAARKPPPLPVRPLLPLSRPRRPAPLPEGAARALLADQGLRFPPSCEAGRDSLEAAAQAVGWPVALKAHGFAHKTEAGAVALNLAGPKALSRAAAAMQGSRFTVEAMAPPGVELLIGVTRDPAHGLILTLGAGGTEAELAGDSAQLLLPAPRREIRAALRGLRLWPRLSGWRGAPPCALAPILDAVAGFQRFALAHAARLETAEINPLICTAEGAIAVDALIVMGEKPA